MKTLDLHFIDNPSIKGREDRYQVVRVKSAAVLKSWRSSLFSFEWLNTDGSIRSLDDLPLHERDKRLKVEESIQKNEELSRPVLGIGMLDNIEIGAAREVFLTLAASGVEVIEAHIPASNVAEFKKFIA